MTRVNVFQWDHCNFETLERRSPETTKQRNFETKKPRKSHCGLEGAKIVFSCLNCLQNAETCVRWVSLFVIDDARLLCLNCPVCDFLIFQKWHRNGSPWLHLTAKHVLHGDLCHICASKSRRIMLRQGPGRRAKKALTLPIRFKQKQEDKRDK